MKTENNKKIGKDDPAYTGRLIENTTSLFAKGKANATENTPSSGEWKTARV